MARVAAVPPSLPDSLVASVIADVRSRRGVARRELPKVAPALRAAFEAALQAVGLEVTRAAVRVPARAQLLALLDAETAVDEKGLATRLACVTGPEAKALVTSLVREERVRRVERLTGTALSVHSAPTVDADAATRLAADLERALKWVRRAARSPRSARLGLLEQDVTELVARLGAAASSAGRAMHVGRPAVPPGPSLLDRLARAAVRLAAQHGGLAPVPLLVRALDASTASVHAALLEGHARGWFELQPESSMGRLGAEDLALCLPGPEGTRLSWVRPLEGVRSASAASAERVAP